MTDKIVNESKRIVEKFTKITASDERQYKMRK